MLRPPLLAMPPILAPCRLLLPFALAALAGCATPGPLHVYSVSGDNAARDVIDIGVRGTGGTTTVPSFLEADDTLTGFAYDPFTDHFFLRLTPGNRIRVVDRPARAIKREFTINSLPAGGDLAVRPRDGHLFLLHAGEPAVTETTRLGKALRTFALSGVRAAAGLACDTAANQLFVLHADGREISRHTLDGERLAASIRLDRAVTGSLAVDGEQRELFAPLAAPSSAIGVFDFNGRLLRQIEITTAARFVDVGPRSLVRVF